MKRVAFVVGLVVLVFAVSVWAQTMAPKPDPEIKKFEAYVGHWTYTVEYKAGPLGPASKATGALTIKKVLKGFFFQNQVTEKGPMGETQIIEMISYDPVKKLFISNEYHDDGLVFSGTYDFKGNVCIYMGKTTIEGKPYFAKNVLTLSADMITLTASGELSTDGSTWVPWLEAKYTRTTPAPITK